MNSNLKLKATWADWLSGVEWKYYLTLHFTPSSNVTRQLAVSRLKRLRERLSRLLMGRKHKDQLCFFAVMEQKPGGAPHVHVLVGGDGHKPMGHEELKRYVAGQWGKQDNCVDPYRLGDKNEGWFDMVEPGTELHLLNYNLKSFQYGQDPVLDEVLSKY